MRNILIFLLIFLSVILETTVLSFPLTAVVFASSLPFVNSDDYWIPLAGGFSFDLFSQKLLGVSSLFYLAVFFVYNRYKKKIHERATIYRLFFVTLVVFINSLLFYRYINWGDLVVAVFLSLLMTFSLTKYVVDIDKPRLNI